MNNKKYWLRSGIAWSIVGLPMALLLGFFQIAYREEGLFYISVVIQLIEVLAVFFVFGAFMGWIYGKIKNRNQVPKV